MKCERKNLRHTIDLLSTHKIASITSFLQLKVRPPEFVNIHVWCAWLDMYSPCSATCVLDGLLQCSVQCTCADTINFGTTFL